MSILITFCIACGLSVLFWAPIKLYHFTYKKLWKWKVAAEIAHTGFNEEDVRGIYLRKRIMPASTEVDDLLDWMKAISDEGKRVMDEKTEQERSNHPEIAIGSKWRPTLKKGDPFADTYYEVTDIKGRYVNLKIVYQFGDGSARYSYCCDEFLRDFYRLMEAE